MSGYKSLATNPDLILWDNESHYTFDLSNDHFHDIRVDSTNEPNNSVSGDKVSDAITYGPRFCEIYAAFNSTLASPIDPSRHLMSLCTEYLIPFCQWARASIDRTVWLKDKLMDHDYLRSEVRNGIIMIIIYTFASIKATLVEGADMFSTLQDHDKGLGIANKFSLRIYNDPYHYLSFLKSCLSSLIDAGVIPDNERINQPKKSKLKYENKDELTSYNQIQTLLLEALDSGNLNNARNLVAHITQYWSQRGKFLRNRRLSSVLQYIQSVEISHPGPNFPPPPSIPIGHVSLDPSSLSTSGKVVVPTNISQIPNVIQYSIGLTDPFVPAAADKDTERISSKMILKDADESRQYASDLTQKALSTSSSSTTVQEFVIDPREKAIAGPIPASLQLPTALSAPHVKAAASLRTPIVALIFDRVLSSEWIIRKMLVYDIDSFIQLMTIRDSSTIYLIDEMRLSQCIDIHSDSDSMSSESVLENMSGVLYSQSKTKGLQIASLRNEFETNKCLAGAWTRAEFKQFQEFIRDCCESSNTAPPVTKPRLLSMWRNRYADSTSSRSVLENDSNTDDLPQSSSKKRQRETSNLNRGDAFGVLAFESVSQVGVVIRMNLQMNLSQDIWCRIYPKELDLEVTMRSSRQPKSAAEMFIKLFPQLKSVFGTKSDDIVVSYYSHRLPPSAITTNNWSNETEFNNQLLNNLPTPPPFASYRTIGKVSDDAVQILSRLDEGTAYFHDFTFSLIA